MINKHSENMGTETFCDRMLSRQLLENISKTFLNGGYEKQLLWNIGETFSEQMFTKHCQQLLFQLFMHAVYHIFNGEYLTNISSITFTTLSYLQSNSQFLKLFCKCFVNHQSMCIENIIYQMFFNNYNVT